MDGFLYGWQLKNECVTYFPVPNKRAGRINEQGVTFLEIHKQAGWNKRAGRRNNLKTVSEHALLLCF